MEYIHVTLDTSRVRGMSICVTLVQFRNIDAIDPVLVLVLNASALVTSYQVTVPVPTLFMVSVEMFM